MVRRIIPPPTDFRHVGSHKNEKAYCRDDKALCRNEKALRKNHVPCYKKLIYNTFYNIRHSIRETARKRTEETNTRKKGHM